MRCLIFMFIIFLSHLAIASAQGLFQYDKVDFFKEIEAQKEPIQLKDKQAIEPVINEWAEPIIDPSGRVSVYLPPKEVRDFLENPTQENARAYIEWNSRRIKKFALASQILAKEALNLEILNNTGDFKAKGSYIIYFMLNACPPCKKQFKVIDDIRQSRPDIKIIGFAKGFSDEKIKTFKFPVKQDNGMAQAFNVTTYPSLLVINKNKQRYLLSGYAEKERILSLLQ